MTIINGHGNTANNAFGKNSRTRITNNVNVQSSNGLTPLPHGQVTLESSHEFGPHAGWYLASAIVTVAGGLWALWRGVSNVIAGFSDTTRTPESDATRFSIPSMLPWAPVFVALVMTALVLYLLFLRANNEEIPISTGRFSQHRHIGGSASSRLRIVRTRAVCPKCKRERLLRLTRVPVAFDERTRGDGSIERVPTKWEFVARCPRNSSHHWSIDEDIISGLVEDDPQTGS